MDNFRFAGKNRVGNCACVLHERFRLTQRRIKPALRFTKWQVQLTSVRALLGVHSISSPPASAEIIITASPYEIDPVRVFR